MLNLVSKITITQNPTTAYPNRKQSFVLDFVNDIETDSGWKNLTATAKLIFPKNVYVNTPEGNVAWADADLYVKTSVEPIFLRGDAIKIELGYFYLNQSGKYVTELNTEFEGFITKINPKIPIEIECEDRMWLLKQARCPNVVFKDNQAIYYHIDYKDNSIVKEKRTFTQKEKFNTTTIIEWLIKNATLDKSNTYLSEVILPQISKINVINGTGASRNIQTTVGDFRTQNETIAQVLSRLRKDYKLECFFRGDSLFCSGIVYYPSDYLDSASGQIRTTAFDFEQNITENQMVYLRTDDVRLGIHAYSVTKHEIANGTNSAGKLKTKQVRLEANVGDTDGEIRTQYFWPDTNTSPDLDQKTLIALATQRLNKLKYEGWRGSFTSFILPFVAHGQAITLTSSVTPERIGTYLVKSVKTKFGQSGARRIIEPHIRIDTTLTITDFANGL